MVCVCGVCGVRLLTFMWRNFESESPVYFASWNDLVNNFSRYGRQHLQTGALG